MHETSKGDIDGRTMSRQRRKLQKKKKKKQLERLPAAKELTSSKQGRTTTIQYKAGKGLTEEQDILSGGQSTAPNCIHTQQQGILRC